MTKISRKTKYVLFSLLSIIIVMFVFDLVYYFVSGYHLTAVIIKADKLVDQSCTIDSDCIVVSNSCSDCDSDSYVTINKSSQDSFNRIKSFQCSGKGYYCLPPDDYNFKESLVVCRNNHCEIDSI